MKKLQAWMRRSNSHGLVLSDLILLPEGDKPEGPQDWIRVRAYDVPACWRCNSTGSVKGEVDGQPRWVPCDGCDGTGQDPIGWR